VKTIAEVLDAVDLGIKHVIQAGIAEPTWTLKEHLTF